MPFNLCYINTLKTEGKAVSFVIIIYRGFQGGSISSRDNGKTTRGKIWEHKSGHIVNTVRAEQMFSEKEPWKEDGEEKYRKEG